MKKISFFLTFAVLLMAITVVIQAQPATDDPDQIELADSYLVGTWQEVTNSDTVDAWDIKRHGNVLLETDYVIINGEKTIYSYWSYSYIPAKKKFYMFAASVRGGFQTGIGSFTSENKWCQQFYEMFNPDIPIRKAEFLFDSPTSLTINVYTPEGEKVRELKYSRKN
jgi:hypothetical protein